MLRTYADVFQFLTLSSASSYKKILSVTVENGTILSLTIQMLQYFVFFAVTSARITSEEASMIHTDAPSFR